MYHHIHNLSKMYNMENSYAKVNKVILSILDTF